MLAVAILLLLVLTLNAPPLAFFVTLNVPGVGYVNVPLVADNSNSPFALFNVTVSAPSTVLYLDLLTL